MKKQEKICRYRHEMKKRLDEIIIHKMEERSERQSRKMAVLNKYAVLLAAEENENQRHNIIAQRKAEMSAVEYDFLKREMELEREYISVRNEMDMVCLEMEDDEPTPNTEGDTTTQQQPTVWLDGSRWTAQVTLRRIINKLPNTNGKDVIFHFTLNCQRGKWCLMLTEIHGDKSNQVLITEGYGQEEQVNDWLQEIREDFE